MNASFYLYFSQRADAEEAAARLRDDGYDVTVREGADDVNWLALASCDMAPEDLHRVEQRMFALADELSGEYDGYERAVRRSQK